MLGALHALAVEPDDTVHHGYEGQDDHERLEELYVRNPYKLLWEHNPDKYQSPKYNPSCDEGPSKHDPDHVFALPMRRVIWGRYTQK